MLAPSKGNAKHPKTWSVSETSDALTGLKAAHVQDPTQQCRPFSTDAPPPAPQSQRPALQAQLLGQLPPIFPFAEPSLPGAELLAPSPATFPQASHPHTSHLESSRPAATSYPAAAARAAVGRAPPAALTATPSSQVQVLLPPPPQFSVLLPPPSAPPSAPGYTTPPQLLAGCGVCAAQAAPPTGCASGYATPTLPATFGELRQLAAAVLPSSASQGHAAAAPPLMGRAATYEFHGEATAPVRSREVRHAAEPGPLPRQRQASVPAMERQVSAQSEPATSASTEQPRQPTPFTWSECHNLIATDTTGVLVRQPSTVAWPAVSSASLQPQRTIAIDRSPTRLGRRQPLCTQAATLCAHR